jgi:hypothetical protein
MRVAMWWGELRGNVMASATAVAHSLHLGWSRWFRCVSSFELSLVPRSPGLFAVAHRDGQGKQLILLKVQACDDLFHSLSLLFSAFHPMRMQFEKGDCVLRYASVPDARMRNEALNELQAWLATPGAPRSAVVEDFLRGHESRPYDDESD